MPIETERKFLPLDGSWRDAPGLDEGRQIAQAYFTDNGGMDARITYGRERRLIIDIADRFGERRIEAPILLTSRNAKLIRHGVDINDNVNIGRGFEARVRLDGSGATVTLKHGKPPMRVEMEFDVEPAVAKQLLRRRVGDLICKTRYELPLEDGLKVEIDEYSGPHRGLVVAEVESPRIDTPYELPFPAKEVTGEKRYSNSALALTSADSGLEL